MEVMESIEKRRSIRSYQDKEVEAEKIEKILEAGRLAPSASNRQEWRYIVVKEKKTRQLLAEAAANQSFVAEAPVIIVCCAETDEHVMGCGQKCYPIDLAISIEQMVLEAVELGLGSCWIGAFSETRVKEILGIPPEIRVVNLLPVGYPKRIPSATSRLPKAVIVKNEKW